VFDGSTATVEFCVAYLDGVSSETFMATKVNEIFSGDELCQLVKNYRRFGDNLPIIRCSDDTFHDVPQSLQTNSGIVPRLGHSRFLPSPFQFIIIRLFYHPTLYNLDTESIIK
jgi:hypothetical protein